MKKKLASARALIKLMESLAAKAKPQMDQLEIERYEKWMKELRKEESLLIDAIFKVGGKLTE